MEKKHVPNHQPVYYWDFPASCLLETYYGLEYHSYPYANHGTGIFTYMTGPSICAKTMLVHISAPWFAYGLGIAIKMVILFIGNHFIGFLV